MKKSLNWLLSLVLIFLICRGSVQADAAALYEAAGVVPGISAASAADSTGGTAETNDAAGVWKLVEITDEESEVSKEELQQYEALGSVIYMEILEDGTVVISFFGEETQGSLDGETVTFQGESLTCEVEGDTLRLINQEGDAMVFERSAMEEIDAIRGYKDGVLDETIAYSEEEETILDTDAAALTITGYKADKTGFIVSLFCENKTDGEIMISEDKCVLNRYQINPSWAISLDAKESREATMTFRPSELEKCGISAVDEMILVLKVVDSENWTTLQENILSTVYPTGKKAEDISPADRTPGLDELVVLDNEDITFVILGTDEEIFLGYAVNCYFENKTDYTLTLLWSDIYFDDQEVTGLFAEQILPGTRGYSNALFLNTSLEEKEIDTDEIEKIRATLRVYNTEGTAPGMVAEEEFTYEP